MGTPAGRERAPERDGDDKAATPKAPAPIGLKGDENTVPWLETEYWKPFLALHRRAFEESIDEEIEGRAGVSSIATLTEEEAPREATRNLRTDVRLVTTLVTRFTNAQAIDPINKFDEPWAQSAQTATGPVGITSIKGMTLTTGLMHLKNGLDGVAAILAVGARSSSARPTSTSRSSRPRSTPSSSSSRSRPAATSAPPTGPARSIPSASASSRWSAAGWTRPTRRWRSPPS